MKELGVPMSSLARKLGISIPSVSERGLQRQKSICCWKLKNLTASPFDTCCANLPGDWALYAVSVRWLTALHLGFLQTPPRGSAPRDQLGIFDLSSANTFVKMFSTLTWFMYRGLSPHKFTPPGIGIFDMPGVHQRMHLPKSVHDPFGLIPRFRR
jgi:hypothetical protein